MRFYLICDDPDTLTGFRLAGVEGTIVSGAAEVSRALDEVLAQEDIAVLLITETAAALCMERVDALRIDVVRPLIAVIPGPEGGGTARESITRLITETIGVKL